MLSNTAMPKYYGEFREKVLRGEILVNREISMEMNRIDELVRDKSIYYDEEAVEGWIRFCETELTKTDGGPLKLLDSFKLWGEQIYGWYKYVEKSIPVPNADRPGTHYELRRMYVPLITKQYLIVARGAAKSMYSACVQAYGLVQDPSTTHQIVTAPTMKQSNEILSPIKTAIAKAPGPYIQFLTEGNIHNSKSNRAAKIGLAATKNGIEDFITNSLLEIRPLSIDKLQGLRCKYSSVDEWLSGPLREDPIGALEQGARKGDGIDDYLIIATSSEGIVRNGAGDTIKMELTKILRGEYRAPHVSIFWYKLDDIKEVGNEKYWIKANPNIGKTVTYEAYKDDVERMASVPSVKNDILAKRFGIPMEGLTYYFTYEETLPHGRQEFWKMACSMGVDLSQGGDFCAFTFLFPLRGNAFGVKTLNFITDLTLDKLPGSARENYERFINEGSLIIMPGAILDMMDVYDVLERHIADHSYDVCAVGYDPYNAKEFIQRWTMENGPFAVEKVIQGARTESVPLTELKNLAGERKLLFDQKLVSWTMGNCVVATDNNGNKKLTKRTYADKIDAVAAMMDALVAYKLNKDAFG